MPTSVTPEPDGPAARAGTAAPTATPEGAAAAEGAAMAEDAGTRPARAVREWPGGPGGNGGNGGPGGPGDEGGGPGRGRGPGRLGYAVIGVLAAVLAGGWAVIMGNANNTPGIASQTITYVVRDASTVEVRYSVAKAKGDEVRCTVDAFDTDFAIVATSRITVPPGTERITRTDVLQTSKRATGARVKDCHKV
ncbi:DUF4307 domain-containing protein [Actinomadura viridis]|uniref:DUF4307 domain-containing protein n=1 Tax=Actinomadura viridis TaxID=58110 RepID=UPI00367F429E